MFEESWRRHDCRKAGPHRYVAGVRWILLGVGVGVAKKLPSGLWFSGGDALGRSDSASFASLPLKQQAWLSLRRIAWQPVSPYMSLECGSAQPFEEHAVGLLCSLETAQPEKLVRRVRLFVLELKTETDGVDA